MRRGRLADRDMNGERFRDVDQKKRPIGDRGRIDRRREAPFKSCTVSWDDGFFMGRAEGGGELIAVEGTSGVREFWSFGLSRRGDSLSPSPHFPFLSTGSRFRSRIDVCSHLLPNPTSIHPRLSHNISFEITTSGRLRTILYPKLVTSEV